MLLAFLLTGCEVPPGSVAEVVVIEPELPKVEAPPPPPLSPVGAQAYRRILIGESRMVWGLNAPAPVFAGQVHQESRWRPDARSPAGAQGLTQFMPATSKWIGQVYPDALGDVKPFSPSWAIRAMVRYDHWLYERIKHAKQECDRMRFALASYNGGLG